MYKLINRTDERTQSKVLCGVLKLNEDGSDIAIPFDPSNTDYQAYLKHIAEGGEVLPADQQGEQA